MKYKVIDKITDGVIIANKNVIICLSEKSIKDDKGEDSLYHSTEIVKGMILSDKNIRNSDVYWSYSKKEFSNLYREFSLIQLQGKVI